MSLARNTLVQSGLTLGSRVLGFARDLALAAQFGQGPMMDAWATALMVPNLFRRLFAEGAFAQAFVPVYGKVRAEEGEAEAADVASQALSFIMAVVLLFVIAAQLLMPWLMPLLLGAYREDPEVLRIATAATQLAMPYLACMTAASLLSGVLNTSGKFALAAGVPIALNICTLAPLLLIPEDEPALLAASAAVTVSGLVQAGLLWWGARRLGVRLRLRPPSLTPVVRRVLIIAVPGALAGGALQLNSLVSQLLTGNYDEGARAVLYNADRLYQLPLGLVGVAIGLALVPRLTRSFVSGDHEAGRATMDEGIGLAMLFTLPAAVALFVAPFFIIDATVSRGEFTSEDARRTADVLRHFAWGVPAFVLAKVLTPPFFARQDTRRPMIYAVVAVGVTVAVGTGLFFGFRAAGMDGVIGLAVATSLSAWVNVALLFGTLVREGIYRPGPAVAGRLLRVGAAAAVMGGVVFAFSIYYELLSRTLGKEVAVLGAVGAGGLVYAGAALVFGAVTKRELKSALRRERGAPSANASGIEP